MPFADAYIPEGVLAPDAERTLIAQLTDLLIEHEGVDPNNPVTRHMAWVFVHRPEVYVAGRPPESPRYRFICQVPEGQYDDERRAALVAGITDAVAQAEDGAFAHPEVRVSVFACEVPDGWWGGAGRILRLADIYEIGWPLWPGMEGEPRETAERVLSERRREAADRLLAAR
jgi:phenylpyruvate tautomerase PptA (4-oxalocrotonate tautomerase family)